MAKHNPIDKHFPPYVCDTVTSQPTFVGPNKSMENFFRVQMHLAGDPVIRSIVRSDDEISLEPHPYHITTETEFGEEDAKRIQNHINQAQTLFRLYKKKECERKRRYKNKGLSPHDTKEFYLNRCGICNRLRPAVNIFWGTVMCEKCYFTPSRIEFVMNRIFLDVEPMEPRNEKEEEEELTQDDVDDAGIRPEYYQIPSLYRDIPFTETPDFCQPPPVFSTPPLIISQLSHSCEDATISPFVLSEPSTPLLNPPPPSPTEDEILQGLLWDNKEDEYNFFLSPSYFM